MFLHIINDSTQINHLIQRTNEMFPDEHLFYAISKTGKLNKILPSDNVIPFIPNQKNITFLLKEISKYKAVFIHNLCYIKSKIVLESPKDTIFIWGVWGEDYYFVFPKLCQNFFLPYTKIINLILFKHSLFLKNIFYYIHPISHYLGIKSQNRTKVKAAKRINFTFNNLLNFSMVYTVVKSDYNTRFNGIYYSIESICKGLKNTPTQLGRNIYIGNSASHASNHLDIFLQLKNKLPKNKKLIVPLSYGCPRYQIVVNIIGRIIFKTQFLPLNKFLPLKRYNEQLLSCNTMIFNHKRAQAFGNIMFGIWAGHKVFLRNENPIYSFLKSIGIKVFTITNTLNSNEFSELDKESKLNNRLIIQKYFGETQIQENFRQIINEINAIEKSKLD